MSQTRTLGMMCNQRDVDVAEALRSVVDQFNRIGSEVGELAAPAAQQEYLVMIAPLVVTELLRLSEESGDTWVAVGHGQDEVMPGWRLVVTAADEVVVRSPAGGPGGMTVPPGGGTLSACLLRELVKALVHQSEGYQGTRDREGGNAIRALTGSSPQAESVTALLA